MRRSRYAIVMRRACRQWQRNVLFELTVKYYHAIMPPAKVLAASAIYNTTAAQRGSLRLGFLATF